MNGKFWEKSTPPLRPLPTPVLGVGGERSEPEGGIFLAPHRLRGGRGPRSGEGGLPKALKGNGKSRKW